MYCVKIIEEYNLVELLGGYFEQRGSGPISGSGQYTRSLQKTMLHSTIRDYTFNHPLFTNGMKQYSDSTVLRFPEFRKQMTRSNWVLKTHGMRPENHREKIYIFPTILRTKTARPETLKWWNSDIRK